MKKILISLFLLVAPVAVFSQGKIPQFKDYAVSETFTGKNAPMVITKNNRDFRTRLKEAAKRKPDFAGRYVVAIWGCGTACVAGALVDAKTGKVYFLPGAIHDFEGDENLDPVVYRLNSRLIIFSGMIDQENGGDGWSSHYYEFKNGKFIHIKTIQRKQN